MRASGNLSGGSAGFRCSFFHFGGLRTFRALHDFKFNLLAFLQRFVAIAGNGGEVDENIRAIVASDEAESLGIVEPFYRSDHVEPPCIAKCPTVAGWRRVH